MGYIKIKDLYFYGNDWKPWKNYNPRRSMADLPKMKGRNDDVLVCGCHRSGTNWIWEIVNMLVRETAEYQKDRKTPTILELQTQDYFDKMTSPRILTYYTYWIGTTLSWDKAIRENPDYPILLVYYEKMKQNPYEEIRRIAEFLGVSTNEEFINDVVHKTEFKNMRTAKLEFLSEESSTMSTVDAKKVRESRENYYRRGEVADWKTHFTVA